MRQPSVTLAALALAAVAAAAIAATHSAAGPATTAAPESPRFLLLIHGGDEPSTAERPAVVDEYRQWARRLASAGQLVAADELAAEAVLLSAPGDGGAVRRSTREPSAGGYFLVAAADLEAALALARDCPALRRGGEVEVVPIRRH